MAAEEEPNGWELLRSIQDLKNSVDKVATGMVTQATFAIYQASQTKDQLDSNGRIKALETAREEDRKTKAQQWFGIGLAIVGAIGSLAVGLILAGLNHGTG